MQGGCLATKPRKQRERAAKPAASSPSYAFGHRHAFIAFLLGPGAHLGGGEILHTKGKVSWFSQILTDAEWAVGRAKCSGKISG